MLLKARAINPPSEFAKQSSVYRNAVIFLPPECMQQGKVNAGGCVVVSSVKKTRACLAFPVNLSQSALSDKQCAVVQNSVFAKCNVLSIAKANEVTSAKTVAFRTEPRLTVDKAHLLETMARTTLCGLPVIVGQEFDFVMADQQRVVLITETVISHISDEKQNLDLQPNVDAVTNGLNHLTVQNGERMTNGFGHEQNTAVVDIPCEPHHVVCRIDSETTFCVTNAKPVAAVACSPTPVSSSHRPKPPLKSSSTSLTNNRGGLFSAHGKAEQQQQFAGYEQQQSFCLELLRHAYLSATYSNNTFAETPSKVTPRAKSKRSSSSHTPSSVVMPGGLSSAGDAHAKSVLLYGVAGVGKSMFVRHIINVFRTSIHDALAVAVLNISPLLLLSAGTSTSVTKNHAAGDDAAGNSIESCVEQISAPQSRNTFHIIVIDELDLVPIQMRAGTTSDSGTSADRKAYAALCSLLDYIHRSNNNVFLIATVRLADSLPISLRRVGRFDIELEIPPPSTADRVALLSILLNNTNSGVDEQITPAQLDPLCRTLHGYIYCDLQSLVMHATRLAARTVENPSSWAPVPVRIETLYSAMHCVRPSAMREIIIDVTHTRWSDIGGYANVKKSMRQSVEWAVHDQPERFRAYGITPPRGVLLFGPPGCSKTLMAKAIACEAGLNFLVIKGPELFNKYVGESERAVREVFRRARFAAPACIFIDEIDALGGERGGAGTISRASAGGQGVSDRMLATLLNELDGVEELKQVVVIAATNRPDVIDKALLRPGRLDRIIYVPLPNDSSRKEILLGRMARMPVEDLLKHEISELVKATEGYSGAELVAVCQEAGMIALEQHLDRQADDLGKLSAAGENLPEVTKSQFFDALKRVKPRTKPETVKFYEIWAQEMAFTHE